jgi:hypothetical protein
MPVVVNSNTYFNRNYWAFSVTSTVTYFVVYLTCVHSFLSKNTKIKVYRVIILPVVLYGCEAWSPTLRGGDRLTVLDIRVVRKIFWPKRGEVIVKWRSLHSEEVYDLNSSPNVIWVIKSRGVR